MARLPARGIPALAGLVATALLVLACAPGTASPSAPSVSASSAAGTGYQAPSIAVSTTAGDVIASADVLPEFDTVLEGQGPDGSRYRLEVPAFAVVTPIVISLRALSPVAIPGGRLVAGVQLEPEGMTFTVPVTLTITPASGNVKALVPLQYAGTAEAATATLGAVKSVDSSSVQLWLGHFSGGMVAEQFTQQSADYWTKAGDYPASGSPADRIAWARATMLALEYDKDYGTDSAPQLNEQRMDNAWDAWVDAEVDIWMAEHADVVQRAKDGKVADAITFLDALDELMTAAILADRDLALLGDTDAASDAKLKALIDTTRTYLESLTKNLETDPGFQKLLKDGLVSDADSVLEITDMLTARARQAALLNDQATADLLLSHVAEWLHKYGMSLAASCLQVPIRRDISVRIAESARLSNDPELQAAMQKCTAAYDAAYGPASPAPSPDPSATPGPSGFTSGWTFNGDTPLGTHRGLKCGGFGGDWTIHGDETLAGAGSVTTLWNVTINEFTLAGTYTHEKVQKLTGSVTTATASGAARIVINTDGSVLMTLDAAPITLTTVTIVGSASVVVSGQVLLFPWYVDTAGACP